MGFNWPLADNNFSWLDRLKICSFFLNPFNRWTQDKFVREYEDLVAKYTGNKYAVFVSSGSTANQLIAQKVKDDLIKKSLWPQKNKVIVNAVTWQTNVSVWAREGFEPIFLDVDLTDFSLDNDKLEQFLEQNSHSVACVFPTSVLGYTPNLFRLKSLESKYKDIKFALDNCENFFGEFGRHNICSEFTSSTSCFIAHQISTGQEGGFIFTNDEDEYIYYLLSRAHGLLRNLIPYKHKLSNSNIIEELNNKLVDKQFDFQTLSSNYRGSDIAAFCGLLDFKRVDKYKERRIKIYSKFKESLDKEKFYLPELRLNTFDVAFCLPIIIKNSNSELLEKVKDVLDKSLIERRGFISGNMLRQLPYQKYGNYQDYKNAEYLNNFALYIGLNFKTTERDIEKLCRLLNEL